MARDAVTITALGMDAATAAASGTSITAANGAVIAAAGDTGKLLIEITHTTASAKDITIKAGVGPRAGRGNLVVSFAAGNDTPVVKVFVIESARFAQANGDIHIDFATSTTGTVKAYRLPHGA